MNWVSRWCLTPEEIEYLWVNSSSWTCFKKVTEISFQSPLTHVVLFTRFGAHEFFFSRIDSWELWNTYQHKRGHKHHFNRRWNWYTLSFELIFILFLKIYTTLGYTFKFKMFHQKASYETIKLIHFVLITDVINSLIELLLLMSRFGYNLVIVARTCNNNNNKRMNNSMTIINARVHVRNRITSGVGTID